MNLDKLKQRLRKKRPLMTVSLQVPEDLIEDLQQIATLRGFSDYQALMKAYIGQGLRVDLEQLDNNLAHSSLVDK